MVEAGQTNLVHNAFAKFSSRSEILGTIFRHDENDEYILESGTMYLWPNYYMGLINVSRRRLA